MPLQDILLGSARRPQEDANHHFLSLLLSQEEDIDSGMRYKDRPIDFRKSTEKNTASRGKSVSLSAGPTTHLVQFSLNFPRVSDIGGGASHRKGEAAHLSARTPGTYCMKTVLGCSPPPKKNKQEEKFSRILSPA